MSRSSKVLVIGDDTRSFLTVVRSLGRAGQAVHVAPFNFRSPALRSRYVQAIHRLPYYLGDGSAWRAAVDALWRAESFDLAIPCDERSLLPFDAHRDWLKARGWRVAIPDRRAVEIFLDKHATRELARGVGVPVAPGRLLTATDTAGGLIDAFGLPIALKPRQSYYLDSLHARRKVVIVRDHRSLEHALERVDRTRTLVEGYVPGYGVGVSVLVDQGTVLQAFEHHRIHDDVAVGGSYYRRSAPLSPDLVAAVNRLMAALAYTGVAMVEFRRDHGGGTYALLEVNARPWGSMPLPVSLGVDFPERWRRLLVDGEATPSVDYRTGIHGRNLVPDLEFLLHDVRGPRRRPFAAARVVGCWLGGFAQIVTGRERSDTFVRDDVRPGTAELTGFVRNATGKLARRLPGIGALHRRRIRHRGRRLLCERLVADQGVIFVCMGNICRSPFAGYLLQARLVGPGHALRVSSAGVLPIEGRRAPPVAQRAADAFGIDLAPHRSRHLDETIVRAGDLVIVFDQVNVSATLDRHPGLAGRIVLLSSLLADAAPIPDPYGQDFETFLETYRRIERAIDQIVGLLAVRRTRMAAGSEAASIEIGIGSMVESR
jgi:protein-tyrosine-phosphatase/predicted ATP-grasp superfamily ATP-dependent carboligase